jgi:hypothetical protein
MDVILPSMKIAGILVQRGTGFPSQAMLQWMHGHRTTPRLHHLPRILDRIRARWRQP